MTQSSKQANRLGRMLPEFRDKFGVGHCRRAPVKTMDWQDEVEAKLNELENLGMATRGRNSCKAGNPGETQQSRSSSRAVNTFDNVV